jgi:sortase (surface protein transpeptidase)
VDAVTDPEIPPSLRRRRAAWAVAAMVVGAALVVLALVLFVSRSGDGDHRRDDPSIVIADSGGQALGSRAATTTTLPPPPPESSAVAAPPPPTTTVPPPAPDLKPVAVRIPAVGIDSSLIPLGLNSDGTLQVPQDFSVAGWYIYRPVPGERGPGIIAGHVDSKSGPAVFYDLRDVDTGMTIEVDRSDGTTAYFNVTGKEQHGKDEFPTERVYGPTTDAELRVITCGGHFDRRVGHYEDNLIVFAVLDRVE